MTVTISSPVYVGRYTRGTVWHTAVEAGGKFVAACGRDATSQHDMTKLTNVQRLHQPMVQLKPLCANRACINRRGDR